MKKHHILFLACGLLFASFILWDWSTNRPAPTPPPPPALSEYGELYHGDHLLRQVASFRGVEGHSQASYFLIAGSSSGSISEEFKVTFAWLGNDDVYRYTTLPISRVRVIPNQNIGKPFVKFRWTSSGGEILYAVFGVNPKDWPEKIDMPLDNGAGKP